MDKAAANGEAFAMTYTISADTRGWAARSGDSRGNFSGLDGAVFWARHVLRLKRITGKLVAGEGVAQADVDRLEADFDRFNRWRRIC